MKPNKKNNKKQHRKKGQSFSTDIIVVVIIVLLGAIFLVVGKIQDVNKGEGLQKVVDEAKKESNTLYNHFKEKEIIDKEENLEVSKLKSIEYQALKRKLNIKDEFAIVLEKNGKLIKLDSEKDLYCYGSEKITVNNKTCMK